MSRLSIFNLAEHLHENLLRGVIVPPHVSMRSARFNVKEETKRVKRLDPLNQILEAIEQSLGS